MKVGAGEAAEMEAPAREALSRGEAADVKTVAKGGAYPVFRRSLAGQY